MYSAGLTDHKVAAVYLGINDGRSEVQTDRRRRKAHLPDPHVQFGSFDLGPVAQTEAIHFFNSTSKHEWALDFYGVQYLDDAFFGLSDGSNVHWEAKEPYRQDEIRRANYIKAVVNPSSPFVALPNHLFLQVKEKWLEAFSEHTESATCSNDKCLVFQPCNEVSGLKDFGILLGSADDIAFDVSDRAAETYNTLRRGPREIIYREWRGMYFRLPFESYMINGDKLGSDPDTCILSITGFLPDDEQLVVLGQPFLNNYYVVLDQDLP